MNYTVLIVLVAVSTASASLIRGLPVLANSEIILKGPSSQAAVVGPDGSAITSIQQGGAVVADRVSPNLALGTVLPGAVAAIQPSLIARSVIGPNIISNIDTVIEGPSGIIRTAGNSLGLIGGIPALGIAPGHASIVGTSGWGLGLGDRIALNGGIWLR